MSELKVMVDAGRASAGAPLGPALGPTGVNIGEVVAKINEKTSAFSGMKVPVKIIINKDKSFELEIGMPPTSALIKKELNIKAASGTPNSSFVGNLTIEQAIKVANMKMDKLNSYKLKAAVKEVIGTCDSMGVSVEGIKAVEAIKAVEEGKFDEKLK